VASGTAAEEIRMSVVNSMLRDLEARSGDLRKPKIPVRAEVATRRNSALLIGIAVIAAAAVGWPKFEGWQKELSPSHEASLPFQKPLAVPAAASVSAVAPPSGQIQSTTPPLPQPKVSLVTQSVTSATASKPSPATRATLHASWQWSSDGFALQLDAAADVRYGIERVDAGTLKISLAHSALAALEIPTPTPTWIDSARVQRDGEQQTITISASTRLEYDVAMLDGSALVISVWRDANAVTKNSAAGNFVTDNVTAGKAAADNATADSSSANNSFANNATPANARIVAPRDYAKPRIDPSPLTSAQRDARQSAQASTQLRAGQQSQALSTLHAALQAGDAAPKSTALLVTILMSQQRMQEAQPYLERALQQTPRDVTLLKLRARMLAAQGEIASARDALAPLLPMTSTDTELLALTASLAQQAHDFVAAASYYLQWTRIEPASGGAWYGLALALDAQALSASAVAAYQHALTLISDARLRDYAGTRIATLQANSAESITTGAAVGVGNKP